MSDESFALFLFLITYLVIGANLWWAALVVRRVARVKTLGYDGFWPHALGWPAVVLLVWPLGAWIWWLERQDIPKPRRRICGECGRFEGEDHADGCSRDLTVATLQEAINGR